MIYCVYFKYLAVISKAVKKTPAATVASSFRDWRGSIEDLRGHPTAISGGASLVHCLCVFAAARADAPASRGKHGASSQIGAGG
jgi:hypothetical protein